jgi:hypothetical protein
MAGSSKALSTQLLGRQVWQRVDRSATDPQTISYEYPWFGRPTTDGKKFGTIEAVWLDKDHTIKIAIRDPHGNVFDAWLTHITLDSK